MSAPYSFIKKNHRRDANTSTCVYENAQMPSDNNISTEIIYTVTRTASERVSVRQKLSLSEKKNKKKEREKIEIMNEKYFFRSKKRVHNSLHHIHSIHMD